jgi:copper(I)-binding protein
MLAVAVILALVTACTAPEGSLQVSGAWVRAAASVNGPTGGYFVVANAAGADDALVAASSPAAGMVEMHETTTSGGMTGMQPVARVVVPGGGTVEFKPGGYHLMLMRLSAPLQAGTKVELALTFERAGRVVVQADVRAP